MKIRGPRLRPGSACLVVVAVMGAGCESGAETIEVPRASEAAAAFVAAWAGQDASALEELASPTGATAARFLRALDARLEEGDIGSFEVALSEPFAEPSPGEIPAAGSEASLRYEVTYRSAAAARPVVLEGGTRITFDAAAAKWQVDLAPEMLLPGLEGAARLRVATKAAARGSILDRTGTILARGSSSARRYPLGPLAGSTIGHLEPVGKGGADPAAGVEPDDLVGASGLELALEERLAGDPGRRLQAVGRRGRVIEVLGRVRPMRGEDVRTTLDVDLQRAAQEAFGGTTGGAVVMAPSTGDLLAIVSSAELDPNNYVGARDLEPFNRALSGLYPPGSALKVVTAAAALETGVVKPGSRVTGPAEYKGVRNFESGVFGSIDFAIAVQFSVNTAFAQVAEKLGPRRLSRFAEAFGFNAPPQMPLGAATSSFPYPEDEGDLLWSAVGQAQVQATPLQMATVAATVANDGKRMEPRIVKSDPVSGRRVLSAKKAKVLTGLMERVVEGGTGVGARIPGVRVAGKTGTAEVDVAGERMNHAWFVCFAPAGDADVAVAVVAELGGIGGRVAAPLAGSILRRVLPLTQ